MDIIVTTPLKNKQLAEAEAQDCIQAGGGFYFRTFFNKPKHLAVGSRIIYVENGFIVGFALVSEIREGRMKCGTSGHDWGYGHHFIMQADSWKWIKPIPMRGFQGWRYSKLEEKQIKVVGNWLDQRPATAKVAPRVPLRLQASKIPMLVDGCIILPEELYGEDEVNGLKKVGVKVQKVDGNYRLTLPASWTMYPKTPHPELHLHLLDRYRRSRAVIANYPQHKRRSNGCVNYCKVAVHKRYCYEFRLSADGQSVMMVAYDRVAKKDLHATGWNVPLPAVDTKRPPNCRFTCHRQFEQQIYNVREWLDRNHSFWEWHN